MFHLTVRLFDRWRQNVFGTKIDAWGEAERVTDIWNTSCHFLWSITGQTHGKMESICFTLKRGKNCVWWHRPCVCLPIDHKKEPIWRRIGLRTVISHDQLVSVSRNILCKPGTRSFVEIVASHNWKPTRHRTYTQIACQKSPLLFKRAIVAFACVRVSCSRIFCEGSPFINNLNDRSRKNPN